MTKSRDSRLTLQIVAAFIAVYLIWGSTYFAIRVAIQTMPPLLMAGVRFLIAGALVYTWVRVRGAERPTFPHWRSALILGALLLFAGNGGVTWAEQYIPSGLAALIVAMVPIYVALLDWLRPGGMRPTALRGVGLVTGFVGVALLIGPLATGGLSINLFAAFVPLVGALCWAAGSLYSRSTKLPASPLVGVGMEMLMGGVLLTGVGLLLGEGGQVHPENFSLDSLLAFGFLIFFGSIVAFSAYIWLLGKVSPGRVSTYAYVNPVVAVFLGWAFASEQVTARTLIAAAVILLAVMIITLSPNRQTVAAPKEFRQGDETPDAIPLPELAETQLAHRSR
jgi:drug/metabolite transporter (DMT)-like permease